MPRRALVTGAAGFVGAALLGRLREAGHDVHGLVRPGGDLWRLEDGDAPLHVVDLADEPAVRALVRRLRPEWIFHLAAHGAYPSQRDVRRMTLTNVLGAVNLVESCLGTGFESFVNAGSSSEYGIVDHAPAEDEEPRPGSDYAATKLTATLYCRAVALRHRVHIPTLRLYSVYGPYEERDRFVPTLAIHGLDGRLPPLVSPGVARDFVHVDDVVDAFLAAASRPGRDPGSVYNVGTGRQTSIAEAVETARRVLSIAAEPLWSTMPDRDWDTSVWVSNPEKIRRELGWRSRVSFEDGFSRLVDWLREDETRLRFYRERRFTGGRAR